MAGGANPQNVQTPNFGGNVFQQSQQALTGALQGTTAAGMNQPDIMAWGAGNGSKCFWRIASGHRRS